MMDDLKIGDPSRASETAEPAPISIAFAAMAARTFCTAADRSTVGCRSLGGFGKSLPQRAWDVGMSWSGDL